MLFGSEEDYKNYLIEGDKASAKDDYLGAVQNYGLAFVVKHTFEANKKLVESLMKLKEADKAKEMSTDFLDQYVETEDGVMLVSDIFLETGDLLGANILVQMVRKRRESLISESLILDIEQRLRSAENRYSRIHEEDLKKQEKELLSLVVEKIELQVKKIKEMSNMPLENYLRVADNLLLNPYLHPMLKVEIANNLVMLSIDKEVSINFWGEIKNFNPINLKPILLMDKFLEVKDLIDKNSSEDTQTEYEKKISELSLEISMLYPFTDEIIDDPKIWANEFLRRWNPENETNNEKTPVKVTDWFNKFDKMLEIFAD